MPPFAAQTSSPSLEAWEFARLSLRLHAFKTTFQGNKYQQKNVAIHSLGRVERSPVSHPRTQRNWMQFIPLMLPPTAQFVFDVRDDQIIFINRGGALVALEISAMCRIAYRADVIIFASSSHAPLCIPSHSSCASWMLAHVETDAFSLVPSTPSRSGLRQFPELGSNPNDRSMTAVLLTTVLETQMMPLFRTRRQSLYCVLLH